ncbi:MAG TPA: MotA/TolQ/ExbB proton channel family protein [Polyangiaceae bacterium]|nr:MotA/TolQ/ExbB proton channel family protein [Polyangiaceae bacterium]
MSFNFAHVWSSMAPLSKGVALVLLAMAVAFIGVTIERLIAFARSTKESRAFAARAGALLEERKLDEIVEVANQHQGSALARLFGPIVNRYIHAHESLGEGGLTPVEMARNESARRLEGIGEEIRRGMNVIATVGSIAPFVGLLGTVLGIIGAFSGIGAAGSAGIGPVMAGISEALVETAFGLLVAIPAVIAFNYLNARVSAIDTALGRSAGELLDELENHFGRSAQSVRRAA